MPTPRPKSEAPWPDQFPIMDGIRSPRRYFPGKLLSNKLAIEAYGIGLARLSEIGGLSIHEIVGNLYDRTLEDIAKSFTNAELELILDGAVQVGARPCR